ncbi:uncharacterized protein LOC133034244 [Cannabis sativa]|uniref:uncharacterized protein LOC133034244 n=1 Tax=Cannabis sativa TaxID=3483 RepID=UPI0029CA40B5|nr:uncharacterized protein LOC133034244 [Cannabis sativa]
MNRKLKLSRIGVGGASGSGSVDGNNNNGLGNRKDLAWKHGFEVDTSGGNAENKKNYIYIKCKYCRKLITGGVARLKQHLAHTRKGVAPCKEVPKEVKNEFVELLKQKILEKCVAQMIFEEMVESGSYYTKTCAPMSATGVIGPINRFMGDGSDRTTAEQIHITPENEKEMRDNVCMDIGRCFFENALPFHLDLNIEGGDTDTIIEDIKKTCPSMGLSIMSDGWSDGRTRSILILINNPKGTVFLKSIDASSFSKNAEKLFKMLDDVIEEIGEHLVVQVVTDNASAYKAVRQPLEAMFTSKEWIECPWAAKPNGKEARKTVLKDKNFWPSLIYAIRYTSPLVEVLRLTILKDKNFSPSVIYVIRTTSPLVEVLRLVDGDKELAMGFLYNAMDKAKEKLANNLGGEEKDYNEIWENH